MEAHVGTSTSVSTALYRKIQDAILIRNRLGLPAESTNVYRLINSEGDHLSGLIVDVLADQIVVQSSGAWVEKHKTFIIQTLSELVPVNRICWKADVSNLKKEGISADTKLEWFKVEVNHNQEKIAERMTEEDELEMALNASDIVVKENSATFLVKLNMQKTGFYCDQRENRAFIRSIAKGKSCLDLCCYTGGFAISAKLGGATEVVGVDSSANAIAMAEANSKENNCQISYYAEDISKFMKDRIEKEEKWDIVVLDPPKLCPSAKFLNRALPKYSKLNMMAMRLVERGGLLVTCTCSGAVTQSGKFLSMIKESADKIGREARVVHVHGAASDHLTSLNYQEGRYLTVATVLIL